jgi:hypothetical protein
MCELSPAQVSGFDTVIHLSGENVAGLWTAEKKRRIGDSRVVSTENLSGAIARAANPPHTFLCASAIGYYGNRGDEILTEASPSGRGFLAEVCREWEAAAESVEQSGIRVVNLRFGIVLSRNGGALKQMLLPFHLRLGGRIGNGRQWWSWIHIEDAVGAVLHLLRENDGSRSPHTSISGPVNFVSPSPVTNREFTRTLAATLMRPALLSVPRFALRLALREFADEGVLASARVMPKKLVESGFQFRYPELNKTLEQLLR